MIPFAVPPIFKAAAETVELGWVMGGMTAFFILFFMGWVLWAWAPANREHMERAARLPFDDDAPPPREV